jgi:hypothetical protein
MVRARRRRCGIGDLGSYRESPGLSAWVGARPLGALATWAAPQMGYWALASAEALFSFPLPENVFLAPKFSRAPRRRRTPPLGDAGEEEEQMVLVTPCRR